MSAGTTDTPPLPPTDHGLSPAQLLRLFELMLLARTVDRRMQALYRQGKITGGVYSQEGNEAVACGTAFALEPGDCLFPMHRGLGARLTHGDRLPVILAQLLARGSGPTAGRDSGLHHDVLDRRIFAMISHLGTQLPVACGAALALRQRGEDRVAVSYIGDGATALGDFHEGLNFAAVLKLPVIVVVENNLWAYSTPNSGEFACATLADRGPGYGVAAELVDGTDVLAVHAAMARAVTRARRGGGPTLLEARAMRLRGHSEADDHAYVPREDLLEGRRKDPLARFELALRRDDVLDDARLGALRAAAEAELETTLKEALALPPPDPSEASWGRWSEEGHPSRGKGVPGVPGLAAHAFGGVTS
jgi:TPP-dependent pyruvate/acetoin dehydrogenase alpha subunit